MLLAAFIWAYNHDKRTPHALHRAWPDVDLPLVYAVLAYYHQNKVDVDAYVEQARLAQERIVEELNRLQPQPTREEWIARLRAVNEAEPTRQRAELLRRLAGE